MTALALNTGPCLTYGFKLAGLSKAGPIAGGYFAKTQSAWALAGYPISKGSCMAYIQSYSMASTSPVALPLISAYAVLLATRNPDVCDATDKVVADTFNATTHVSNQVYDGTK